MSHRLRIILGVCVIAALLAIIPDLLAQTSRSTPSIVSDEALVSLPGEAAAEPRPVPPDVQRKVRAFLDYFVDAGKTPEEMAMLFAEDAQYYERGAVGRAEIARDVARNNRHWAQRSYRVIDVSYMSADPESDGVFVAYTIAFDVANRSRAIRGTATYAALIGNLDGTPRMLAIRERVTQRQANARPNAVTEDAAITGSRMGTEEQDVSGSSGASIAEASGR